MMRYTMPLVKSHAGVVWRIIENHKASAAQYVCRILKVGRLQGACPMPAHIPLELCGQVAHPTWLMPCMQTRRVNCVAFITKTFVCVFQRGIRDIAGLYGTELSLDGVQKYRKGNELQSISSICFKAARIAAVLIDDGIEFDKMHDIEWHRNFAPMVGRILRIEHLAEKILDELSPDDAFVTSGCTQAIDVALSMLARPGVNILLPRPGFPIYELCAAFRHLEVRHFDLDLCQLLRNHNTAAMVIVNPGNPCGNVYTYQHLKKIAETAKRLKILVIADEVYGLLAFGANPFVLMGVFGSVVPVLTLSSLSKRWMVPGWRLGWYCF
ncbi:putative aminotransferase TAT2 [Camellia lanceoleosa]|uniref:Aminotransferase TAT2 n=1 Tax=Camellia lanceoleosa TaxID=1840588 RepID=A0ACC0FAA9_9ERIC|nr:putative aminotransferase TAT2 [Camellia lanceoleosa]